ncbi:MAG TPA: hypothetical protein VHF22_04885, partial [Planctomycetota bacterium]|nr:hypothetical protein [Planctomycetota bacterium]
EGRLREIAGMVLAPIPPGAPWKRFKAAAAERAPARELSGFLLARSGGTLRALDLFAEEVELPETSTAVEDRSFADDAAVLREAREAAASGSDPFKGMDVLSRRGGLTGQFEPRFVSLPEALLAAWSLARGDRATAAKVILPCMDAMDDDRWLVDAVRDLLGNFYHQAMLAAFSGRDYPRTLELARHLSKAAFDGFGYQDRARLLAAQVARRGDDFRAFRLPTPAEWAALEKTLDRPAQVRYLAERLRLLNCFQWSQPGGVSYADPQYAEAERGVPSGPTPTVVVNPYGALRDLKLEVKDLPALAPFLADEEFMPTYSYWRDFHPSRTLHQVNWAVAELVNEVAHRDLADLETYAGLDPAGRKAHIEKILAWCAENAGKTRAELLLETLRAAKEWREFAAAAGEAVHDKVPGTLPVLVSRTADFPANRARIARLARDLDTAEAVPAARAWLASGDARTRFWAALILIAHGDRDRLEGLPELRAALEADRGEELYPSAIEPLLATGEPEALALADGILEGKRRLYGFAERAVLHRLLLARREAAFRYLERELESRKPAGTSSG